MKELYAYIQANSRGYLHAKHVGSAKRVEDGGRAVNSHAFKRTRGSHARDQCPYVVVSINLTFGHRAERVYLG